MKHSILKTSVLVILLGLLLSLAVSCALAETWTITYYDYDGNKIEGFADRHYSYTENMMYRYLPTAQEYPDILPEERNGRIFAGWCTNKDLSGEVLTYSKYGWSGDLTLYACYVDYYTVTWYSSDGETVLTADDMKWPDNFFDKYTSLKGYYCPQPIAPERKGFIGWSTTPNDINNRMYGIPRGTTGDLKLYAVYGDIYSITYYDGDTKIEGFDDWYSSYTEGGEEYFFLPGAGEYPELLPERDGQIFAGWCMNKDLSGEVFTNSAEDWHEDITLYACYADYYTVTWYSWDGTTVLTADDMKWPDEFFDKYTSLKEYYCPTPITPEGSTFVGWYRSSSFSGEPMWVLEKGTRGNLKLYARFVSIENFSVTPRAWVLNSDASAAGGKLTVRVKGVDPSFVKVYRSSDAMTTVVENTEKAEYYIWAGDKEKASDDDVIVAVGTVWQGISLTFRDMPNILTLPAAMQTIKAEAFMNCTNIDGISVRGNKLTEIQSGAFKSCTGLYFIELPDSVTTIADDAFEGCANVQFYCSDNSTAAAYAEAHGIPHSPLYQE